MNIFVSVEGSQHYEDAVWKLLTDQANRFGSAQFGQTKIHQADIRLVLAEQSDRFFSRARLGYHREIRLSSQHGDQPEPHDRVIVHHHDSNRRSVVHEIDTVRLRPIGNSATTRVPCLWWLIRRSEPPICSIRSRIPNKP